MEERTNMTARGHENGLTGKTTRYARPRSSSSAAFPPPTATRFEPTRSLAVLHKKNGVDLFFYCHQISGYYSSSF